MPFPVQEQYVRAAETKLGVLLPARFVQLLIEENGGEIDVAEDDWQLFPVLDSSSRKRISRTCNDIVLETGQARSWVGFPREGVAIAGNGCGDMLVLLPSASAPEQLGPEVLRFDHETGQLSVVLEDVSKLRRG